MDDLTRRKLNRHSEEGQRDSLERFGMDLGPNHFDKEGYGIGLGDWAALMEDDEYKIVKQESLPWDAWISTVWLGMDHSFGMGARPRIFETMIFRSYGRGGAPVLPLGGHDFGGPVRWCTEAQAGAAHGVIVGLWGKVPWWRQCWRIIRESVEDAMDDHEWPRRDAPQPPPLWLVSPQGD